MQRIAKYSLIFIILFTSCGPVSIIPEKDMVSIIVKIQLIDATAQNEVYRNAFFNKDTIDYYGRTIESYGYTQAQFDSSLNYYSKTPKDLDAIYDKVIIELSKMETILSAQNKIFDDSLARDTIKNLWNLNLSYELPDTGHQVTIDFMIPVKGLGVYTIAADVYYDNEKETVNPSMEAYFYFDDKSKDGSKSGITTKIYERVKDTLTYSMQLELKNSLVTHLKGMLFNNNKGTIINAQHASIKNIKVYYKPGRIQYENVPRKFKRKQLLEER